MGKSLTETARAVLMKEELKKDEKVLEEGAIPSVSSSDSNPDRGAKSTNSNMATLKPKAKSSESDPKHNEAKTVGDSPKKPGDGSNVGAAAAAGIGKDSSIKASVPAMSSKKLSEDEEIDEDTVDEEFELSEELTAFIDALIEEGLSEEEIAEAIEENFDFVTEGDDVEAISEEEDYTVDMQEHVDALFEGEDLSEEFKAKALSIFEAAVTSKVKSEVAIIAEALEAAKIEEIEAIQEEIASSVNDYLNYVVEGWVEDNEVAIESGLRTELTEDFISSLRNVFVEHYIDIPEDKVSVFEEMSGKIEELEDKLNEEIARGVELTKMLNEATQEEVLGDITEGLTDTQVEKFKSLTESVEFTSAKEYAAKLETIKESYFPVGGKKEAKGLDKAESVTDGKGMIAESTSPRMESYVRTLGRTVKS